jgi:hypothetical protein
MGSRMSSGAAEHDRDYPELVFLHALRALPSSEIPTLEAHLSACAECRQEMEALRPIVGAFVSWPTLPTSLPCRSRRAVPAPRRAVDRRQEALSRGLRPGGGGTGDQRVWRPVARAFSSRPRETYFGDFFAFLIREAVPPGRRHS